MQKYRHGNESLEKEMFKIQLFLELLSDIMAGTDKAGDNGMFEEWQQDRATRRTLHRGATMLVSIAAVLVGVEAALNIIHWLKP